MDMASLCQFIGEDNLEEVWREIREQWALDMWNGVLEQELISAEARKNPGKINRVLDCVPDLYMHPMFINWMQVSEGWEPNWTRDPDKVRYAKRKYPMIKAPVEKPQDRTGWTRAAERGAAGLVLTDRRGAVL